MQLLISAGLRVQFAWMKILIFLQELILEIDWPKLSVLADLVE